MTNPQQLFLDLIASPAFVRANFGGPRRGGPESPWLRVSVRKLGERWQFERFDAKQAHAKNVDEPHAELEHVLSLQFSSIHIATTTETIDVRVSKKGKVFITRRAAETKPETHNRVKDHPLPEGKADAFLEALGILGRDGKVRPTHRDKFTQINEFLKHLTHVLDDSGLRSLGRPIEILDAGCGSSYLTLAVHHYLKQKLSLPANVVGVDVNESVIRKSTERAAKLGAEGIAFHCQRIGELKPNADIVISLHACDTATDAALAAAVKSEAKLILCVPCCHHHLNAQLKAAKVEVLRPILRHGILHERQADLITDAFRALLLRMHGYRVDMVEFVNPEHTARNLMLRAVRVGGAIGHDDYESMKAFFGVVPYLESIVVQIPPSL